jgi:Cu/Zn superoxide dismutase
MRRAPTCVRLSGHTHASDSRGDTLRRIIKAALGGVASCALILGATQAATGSLVEDYEHSDFLVDLNTAPGPFDGEEAKATLRIKKNLEDGTEFTLLVEGIDPSASGVEFGSHLHIGPCVENKPLLALGHYNDDLAPPVDLTREALHKTEVWFDLVPDDHGNANDDTTVPFVPRDTEDPFSVGVMSVVIHVAPTDHQTGSASGRQACLPLDDVSRWAS